MGFDYKQIGALLRKQREEQNRDIDKIAEDLKIGERYLAAIEAGQIDELPSNSKIYYNLFVRSYAKELGLDPEELLESMEFYEQEKEDESSAVQEEVPEEIENSRPHGETPLYKIGIWLAVLVIIIFGVIFVLSELGEDKAANTATHEEVEESPEEFADSSVIGDSLSADESMVPGELSEQAEIANDTVRNTMKDTTRPVVVEAVDSLELYISISELSWMQVVADNDTALEDNLDSGVTRSFKAADSFMISLGNPAGVSLKINDTLLRPLSRRGRPIKDVLITRNNLKDFYLEPGE